jgi:hypothetical protein
MRNAIRGQGPFTCSRFDSEPTAQPAAARDIADAELLATEPAALGAARSRENFTG